MLFLFYVCNKRTARAVNLCEMIAMRNEKLAFTPSFFFSSNFDMRKKLKSKKKKKKKKGYQLAGTCRTCRHTHFVCAFTYIYLRWCRKFCMPDGRKISDAGDFICLAGEREKKCLGRRLPLNAGELTVLVQQTGYKLWTSCKSDYNVEKRSTDKV